MVRYRDRYVYQIGETPCGDLLRTTRLKRNFLVDFKNFKRDFN